MPRFPSDDWLKEYIERINASEDYRKAAATWTGDIAYVVEAEPDRGVGDDVWLWLDLRRGECRDGGIVTPDRGEQSAYVIRAPYSRWKGVIRKELHPIKAMIQGKLKLKGDLPAILRHLKAANELVNIAASVQTDFPDETP